MEEETTASGSDARTVRKLTGETPGAQSIWDVTGTVMEERRVEETPPSIWEQVPSTERCQVTGESSKCTEKVQQQEVAKELPQDHKSDEEDEEDEESSSEVN